MITNTLKYDISVTIQYIMLLINHSYQVIVFIFFYLKYQIKLLTTSTIRIAITNTDTHILNLILQEYPSY